MISSDYHMPPATHDDAGNERRAGFEFEFGNLPIAKASKALCDSLGGSLEEISPFEAILHDSQMGRLKIERDADALKSMRYRKLLSNLGMEFTPGTLGHELETNLDNASRGIIPCEVVTAPIPFGELNGLDKLVTTLNELGAEGTQDSFIYAFGMHINPSLPSRDSSSIVRYIQAFLLLHAWIVDSSGIDKTRRYLTKYIASFPADYMLLVLSRDYRPDQNTLIDDYMRHNPTRNRALDMLPIFCDLDDNRVRKQLNKDERDLVKGRPAFHYRLPDCKVNDPGWSASDAWNKWVYIEKLASDEALLEELITLWIANNEDFTLAPKSRWVQSLTNALSQRFFDQ